MPIITSKGYKLPQKGEKVTWWQNLIDNWIRIDAHSHDGVNSQKIKLNNALKDADNILSANWLTDLLLPVPYYQDITMPTGSSFDNTIIEFYDNASGDRVYPKIVKTSISTYTVFVNDDTLNLRVVYV